MELMDEVRNILDLSGVGSKHDEVLEGLLLATLRAAYDYMRVDYGKVEDEIKYFDGGRFTIILPRVNVSAILVEEVLYPDGVEEVYRELVEKVDYFLYEETGVIRFENQGLCVGTQSIKVTYSAGFDDVELPASFRKKIVKQVSYEFRRRMDPGLSATSFPDGTVMKMVIDEWLPDVKMELNRRKRVRL